MKYLRQSFIDDNFQITGDSIVQVRCEKMLPAFIDREDEICTHGHVPQWNFAPQMNG